MCSEDFIENVASTDAKYFEIDQPAKYNPLTCPGSSGLAKRFTKGSLCKYHNVADPDELFKQIHEKYQRSSELIFKIWGNVIFKYKKHDVCCFCSFPTVLTNFGPSHMVNHIKCKKAKAGHWHHILFSWFVLLI